MVSACRENTSENWAGAELNRRHTDFQSEIKPPPTDRKDLSDSDLRAEPGEAPGPGAAECAAQPANDSLLGYVVRAWPTLPEAVRARIIGLVEGATAR